MSDYAIRPQSVNGLTTAVNAAVTATAAGIQVKGSAVMISVGTVAASAFPIFIMFGKENLAATLTSTTGWRLPAGFVGRISIPSGATHLYHLRAAASDSDISVLGADGGT
jgi:hypothetical protein